MFKARFKAALGTYILVATAFVGCGGASSQDIPGSLNQSGPATIARGSRQYSTDFLLFAGSGTWAPEVESLKGLLDEKGVSFDVVDQGDLNEMSLDELAQYGAFVWPGGNGQGQMDGLSKAARIRIRQAVQERGVGWIGFCAGSFVAAAPKPAPDEIPEYGLGIVEGPVMDYYYLEYELSPDFAIVPHKLANGEKRDLVWYGGPVVPETKAGVIARYPNGQASISQTWSGNGFVIMSAVHPAAPAYVRDTFGVRDSDGTDHEFAWQLIQAVLKQKELPAV